MFMLWKLNALMCNLRGQVFVNAAIWGFKKRILRTQFYKYVKVHLGGRNDFKWVKVHFKSICPPTRAIGFASFCFYSNSLLYFN